MRDTPARDGADRTGLVVDPGGTNRSVNLVYRDGRRKNFYGGRGSMTLQPDLALCRSAGDDRFLTRRELDERFAPLRR